MKIKTQLFKDACKTILLAVDDNAANLELKSKDDGLFLNVTNREYYVSIKYGLEEKEDFHATVDATLFLNLVSTLTVDEFELKIKDNLVLLKAGKSSYKLPMIYENDSVMSLPPIFLQNPTVEMAISNDILKSIVNVNSKELLKVKNLKNVDVNPLQRFYYIDETGCFTFTTGSCMNSFSLEKPVKLLLNDRIVKLFRLFKSDVSFSFGSDQLADGSLQNKVIFETEDVYLAAIIVNDDALVSKVQKPCSATRNYISENYPVKAVISANALSAAISRLMLFTKNSIDSINMLNIFGTVSINEDEMQITDSMGNIESVQIENGSYVESPYSFYVKLSDIKLVLDSCKDEHITLNCGNSKTVILTRGPISNVIPESKKTNA